MYGKYVFFYSIPRPQFTDKYTYIVRIINKLSS